MNGFERRKEQKKESIRRAALDLFKLYGIKKISVNDIAAKARVSPVTIYNHFGCKEDLVRDVVKWLITNTVSHYRSIMEGDQPYLERFGRLVFEKNEFVHTYHGELIQSMLSEDPEIRRFMEELQQETEPLSTAFLEEGKREGFVSRDLSQQSIMLYMEMFRTLAFTHPALFSDREDAGEQLGELLRLFLYGLMGKEEYPDLLRAFKPAGQAVGR